MEYTDFTLQRIALHKEIMKAIILLMKETRTEEINLQDTEGDSGWLVRCNPEMVEVTHLKLQGGTLLYKGRTEDAADEKWLPMDEGSSVVAATIDSLYEAVWQRIGKVALW